MKQEKKVNKTVAVSGYFNPMHVGHLRMFEEAKKLGNHLTVIVNNDYQVKLKGSVPFMSLKDRMRLIRGLKCVDNVVASLDTDKTVCETLRQIQPDIFANGGDRKSAKDIPESQVCKEFHIQMIFNVGGKKVRSSSTLISKASKKAKAKHTDGICQACRPAFKDIIGKK